MLCDFPFDRLLDRGAMAVALDGRLSAKPVALCATVAKIVEPSKGRL